MNFTKKMENILDDVINHNVLLPPLPLLPLNFHMFVSHLKSRSQSRKPLLQ